MQTPACAGLAGLDVPEEEEEGGCRVHVWPLAAV